jgi:hypothetical protein
MGNRHGADLFSQDSGEENGAKIIERRHGYRE